MAMVKDGRKSLLGLQWHELTPQTNSNWIRNCLCTLQRGAMLKDTGSWKECGWMEVEPLVILQWKLASANNMLNVLHQ